MREQIPVDFKDREVRFTPLGHVESHGVVGTVLIPLAQCRECSAVVIEDDEQANLGEHEWFHRRTWATLRALRDSKADAPYAI